MTQNHQTRQSLSTVTAAVNRCGNCNSDDHWVLHNIKFKSECLKLCTSCVLKLHPTSFCPTCFNLHDPNSLNPPPLSSSSSSSSSSHRTLTCLKCSSVSHITCVPPNTPKSPYLCPPCSNPSFKFFDLKKPRKSRDHPHSAAVGGGRFQTEKVLEELQQYLDDRTARVLLLAAKISTMSMNKALALARTEAERKVGEAALARKRAKEAIDHVMSLSSRFSNVKQNRRDVLSIPGANYAPVKAETNGRAHNVGVAAGDNNVGSGKGLMAVAPMVRSNGGINGNNNRVGSGGNMESAR